jgi:hypothetical protein
VLRFGPSTLQSNDDLAGELHIKYVSASAQQVNSSNLFVFEAFEDAAVTYS